MSLQESSVWPVGSSPERVVQVVARAIYTSIFSSRITNCVTASTIWRDEFVPDLHDSRACVQVVWANTKSITWGLLSSVKRCYLSFQDNEGNIYLFERVWTDQFTALYVNNIKELIFGLLDLITFSLTLATKGRFLVSNTTHKGHMKRTWCTKCQNRPNFVIF